MFFFFRSDRVLLLEKRSVRKLMCNIFPSNANHRSFVVGVFLLSNKDSKQRTRAKHKFW